MPAVPYEAYLALAGATAELVRSRVRRGEADAIPALEDTIVSLHLAIMAGRRWEVPRLRAPGDERGVVAGQLHAPAVNTASALSLPSPASARAAWAASASIIGETARGPGQRLRSGS